MRATVGDRFHVRGKIVGQPERTGEIAAGAALLASQGAVVVVLGGGRVARG